MSPVRSTALEGTWARCGAPRGNGQQPGAEHRAGNKEFCSCPERV